ncbi:DUF1993 domain-containing protein [Curvibacter delicatus]|jgi:hypothetical protein|uniref:DUF1993 domain-containing protein n=1 Tax=Curvibacter delicatus TaxID=80879 RepID=UPI000834F77F|nr:DUF1993 domain-containing protein [Curvibacter delicatus]
MRLSSASLPVFRKALGNLRHIVQKGINDAKARGYAPQVLMQARLAPDMLPFSRQVTVACDVVKIWGHRMQGLEPPKYPNDETALEQLQTRIDQTLSWLSTLPPDGLDGMADQDITMPAGLGQTRTLCGEDYLQQWALPNLFFHITTAYAILRHNGVPLNKHDYLYGPDD